MRRALKWIGLTVAGLVVVLVAAAGALVLLFDWNWFKDTIVTRASEATGRKVVIEGDIDGTLSLVPHIRMSGVRVANAEWAQDRAEDMISVESLDFRIELLELLRGRMVLPEVNLAGADISLSKREDGTPNWELGPSVAGAAFEAAVPQERAEFPVVGQLTIDDSRLDYLDPTREIDITVGIASVDAEGGERGVRMTGHGMYRTERFEVALSAGELLDLREEEKPYPLDLRLRIGETTFEGRGTARRPLDFDGLDFDLRLTGADLADLFPAIGIPMPPTASYGLSGRLTRQQHLWSFTGFEGRVGGSDLRGDLTLNFGEETPFMKADFVSDRLDFDDLGGFIGAPPGEEVPTRGRDRVLPDMDIRLDRLHAMNMHVAFRGERIVAPNLPIDRMDVVLILKDGQLTLDPIEFRAAGGTLSGPLVFDGREKIPVVRTDLMVKGMQLKRIMDEIGMGEQTAGTFGGRIVLSGRGTSLAEVFGNADGRVTVVMSDGSMSPMLVELIGLDIAGALAIAVAGEVEPVRIRCAVGALDARDGTLHTKAFVFDTETANIWIWGSVDLGDERLAVRVQSEPKDPSPLSANAPIAITGPIKSPGIAIDPLGTEGQGGLAEGIGKVLNPILALLPFFDVGLAEDIDCGPFEPGNEGARPAGRQ